MRVQYMSKKAIRELTSSLRSRRELDTELVDLIENSESVKIVEPSEKFKLIVADDKPVLFMRKGIDVWIPTLFIVNVILNQKRKMIVPAIVVDEGAVGPITRGADVMAPGIRRIVRDFEVNDFVAVLEPNERYAIAIGIALRKSSEIVPGVKGKAIKNLNWLNDDIWSFCLECARKSG